MQLSSYKDNNKIASKEHDNLIFDNVDFYTDLVSGIEDLNAFIDDDIIENTKYWRDNYLWFASVVKAKTNSEIINYISSSKEYKNKVAYRYILIYQNYVPILNKNKQTADELIRRIESRFANDD